MKHGRHRAFAFESLLRGKGYWWIVHEISQTGSLTEEEAHAVVGEVWAEAMAVSLRRNRRLFRIGLVLAVLPLGFFAISPVFGAFALLLHPLTLAPFVIGASMAAYGWSGLRRHARSGMNPGCEAPFNLHPMNSPLDPGKLKS